MTVTETLPRKMYIDDETFERTEYEQPHGQTRCGKKVYRSDLYGNPFNNNKGRNLHLVHMTVMVI